MSSRMSFTVYCLERYRYYRKLSGAETARLFEEKGIFAYIDTVYGALHTMGERYIVEDIDELIAGDAVVSNRGDVKEKQHIVYGVYGRE